jgi:hypothetical protein
MLQRFLPILLILLGIHFTGQAQWQLKKEENGISIYTAPSDSPNIRSIKTVAEFNGTCKKLVAIFRDIERQKQWVYAAREAYTIKEIDGNELLYYVETALPWPARNRDAAVRMKINQNSAGNTVNITTIGEPQAAPAQNGKIRVPHFEGRWEVKAVGADKIYIEYYLNIDPGGNVPSWITDLFIAKGPYETFTNLLQLLEN